MLKSRVIPCLDVKEGRVVKGVKFLGLRDSGDPVELARRYEEQGADEIVMLDVSATNQGRLAMLETVEKIRETLSIPLTVGGGVRTIADAQQLLNHGADKVSVNSAAVARPELVQEMAGRFGSQCTVVAIDARRLGGNQVDEDQRWEVVTRSGTQAEPLDVLDWGRNCELLGAGEILLTSMDRDGTGQGYDCELLQQFCSRVRLPVIASGGAKTLEDLVDGFRAGAHAVLAATIFHDQEITIGELKQALAAKGVPVR
jgi:imidazoleglycerol phosphate synthase cyclase subunit